MARGVQLAITLNPREFLRALRQVELSTEDVADAFDEIETAGDSAFDDVEASAKAAADDIENAFSGVSREVRSEFDRMERAAGDTDLDVSRGADSAKQAAGVLAGEVVDEFVENWGEAVRSGDYAGAVRETLSQLGQVGGAIGGPVGAVIGGALALGLTTAFDKAIASSQEAARIQAAVRDIFLGVTDEAEEAGGNSWTAYRDAVIAAAKSDEAHR